MLISLYSPYSVMKHAHYNTPYGSSENKFIKAKFNTMPLEKNTLNGSLFFIYVIGSLHPINNNPIYNISFYLTIALLCQSLVMTFYLPPSVLEYAMTDTQNYYIFYIIVSPHNIHSFNHTPYNSIHPPYSTSSHFSLLMNLNEFYPLFLKNIIFNNKHLVYIIF